MKVDSGEVRKKSVANMRIKYFVFLLKKKHIAKVIKKLNSLETFL